MRRSGGLGKGSRYGGVELGGGRAGKEGRQEDSYNKSMQSKMIKIRVVEGTSWRNRGGEGGGGREGRRGVKEEVRKERIGEEGVWG